jgi:hypothetical protein
MDPTHINEQILVVLKGERARTGGGTPPQTDKLT